jgi:hypothetical protein
MGVAGGRSTYDPTFLSNPQNQYKSWLCGDMKNDRWEPGTLLIAAYHPDKNVETDEPYLTVKAKLSPKDDSVVERCITPTSGVGANEWAIHFCEAGGRVAEIDAVAGGAEPDQTKHFGLLRKLCALRRGTLVYFDGGPDPSAPHAPMPRKEWPVDACK